MNEDIIIIDTVKWYNFPNKSRGVINVPKALADEIGWKDKEKLHATYNKETQEMTIKKL
jgi:hypothetical protein